MTTAIDFPNSPPPNDGDTYTASNGITYTFQGGRWTGNTALPPTDRLVSNGHEVVLGSDGVLTVGDIIPLTAANKFGSITNPFKDIYVSQGSIYIAGQDTDAFNISNRTGYLVFSRGGLKVTSNDNLHEIFQLDNTGKLLIKSEIPVIQDSAAFEVIGNLQGTSLGVYNYGVMIHSSGAVDIPSRVYVDGVGTQISGQSAYAAFIGRHARGSVSSPQAVEADDIIVRFGGNAWANTLGLNSTSNVRIDMVATETQSDTNRGSKIELWTTPVGSPDPNLSLSVSSDGLLLPYGSIIRDYAYHSGTPANITLTAIGNTSAIWRLLSDGTTEFPNYTFPAAHGTANQVLVDNGSGVLSWVNGPVGYTGSIGNTGYTGSQGVKGDTGTSVELLGSKATIADLPAAPIDWNDFAGHGWIVITGDGMTHGDGNLWFWNLSTGQWDDVGPIVGPQGIRGTTGYTGSIGSTGYSGSLGYTGSAGYAGNDGYTGSKGDRGYTGSVGYAGSQGVGYTGSQGTNGYTGSKGSDGVIGRDGYTGSIGIIGYTGSQGIIGYTGSQGIIGFTGSAGTNGYTGSAGNNGFTGSAGTNGYTGSAGNNGFTGSTGTNGTNGYTGSAGTNGTNGFTGSAGNNGFTGSAGYTGSAGNNGFTGSAGYTGSQGIIGFTGSAGTNGYTGSQGVIGYSGSLGYTGSQGIIGFTGSAGTNGYTGSQGSTGYAGSKGDTGAAGSQGLSTTIYNYKANTPNRTISDPGNTKLSWNNATQISATTLSVNVNTVDGIDITVYLALLQNTQTFIIQDKNDAANYQNWRINGSVTNAGSYFTIPVTYVLSGGTGTSNFSDNHEIFLGLLVGAQGAIGYTGSRGYIGSAGYTGSVGYTGSLGYTGSQGVIGYTGSLGYTGSQGIIGYTGSQGVIGYSGSLGYTGSKGDIGYTGSFNGQIIATGTLNADYIQVEKSANQTFVAQNADINFNTVTATNNGIAHTAGVFSLTAGKTYLLEATLAVNAFTSTSAFIWYSWVDATNNSQLDTSNGASVSTGSSGVAVPKTWTANDDYSSTARLVYTPATNQTVKLRATDGSGTCTVLAIGTRATIIQVSHTFALSALDTISTTGNVSVGGNLTVTGGVRKSARVLTTTTTLTVADASGFIEFAGSGIYTVTLPDPTQAANSGIGYRFWQNTTSNITLSTPAGNFYGPSGSSTSTKVLAQATTQYWDVWSDGYNWAVFGIKIA